jgi:hypothetical protein
VIEYNVRPGCPAADGARFSLKTRDGKLAEMRYMKDGAELWLGGKKLLTVEGTVRCEIVFDRPIVFRAPVFGPETKLGSGKRIASLEGIVEGEQSVKVTWANGVSKRIKVTAVEELPGLIP